MYKRQYEIYVGNIVAMLNDAAYEPYRVTTNEHMDVLPQWSPDGTRIAFTSWQGAHKHVWVVDADGTNLERVTSGPAGTENGLATWSPDGTKIAFVSNRGGGYDVYMMDAAGENGRSGNVERITDEQAPDHWLWPDWSPLLSQTPEPVQALACPMELSLIHI